MRCPWRPSCLDECGNSGLPRAARWERKQNDPGPSCAPASSPGAALASPRPQARQVLPAAPPPTGRPGPHEDSPRLDTSCQKLHHCLFLLSTRQSQKCVPPAEALPCLPAALGRSIPVVPTPLPGEAAAGSGDSGALPRLRGSLGERAHP